MTQRRIVVISLAMELDIEHYNMLVGVENSKAASEPIVIWADGHQADAFVTDLRWVEE